MIWFSFVNWITKSKLFQENFLQFDTRLQREDQFKKRTSDLTVSREIVQISADTSHTSLLPFQLRDGAKADDFKTPSRSFWKSRGEGRRKVWREKRSRRIRYRHRFLKTFRIAYDSSGKNPPSSKSICFALRWRRKPSLDGWKIPFFKLHYRYAVKLN